jgi:selenide,water dikinase
MNTAAPALPLAKMLVLVGAGNAHLVFLKRWGMRPLPGVAVTLVTEFPVIPYSAMVPAHIAGDYSYDEVTIDLVRLCQAVKVRLVIGKVTGIDRMGRRVLVEGRPPLAFDAASLNLGSIPQCPANLLAEESSWFLRPLGVLLAKIDALDRELKRSPRPFHLVVVGGGASGCELALALQKRLGGHAGFRLTLLQGDQRLLPQFPARVARAFEGAFAQRGMDFRLNARVTAGTAGTLQLEGGDRLACDAVLWATNAAPPALLRDSGLALDAGGFLQVNQTLQTVNDPALFGTGDCVAFPAYPALPRNGVYAVRQGAVLFDNLGAFLRERPLRPFRPQRICLVLLSTADGKAVLNYGPFSWKSRGSRWLKDRIDRAWIWKFTQFEPMTAAAEPAAESSEMRCGGCGSKISSDVLSAVLKRIDVEDDPRILMGTRAGEDAAVHRMRPGLFGTDPDKLVEVQTVDYFKAFIDDPYLFGRIAALNAVSDLFAMNARPFSALAIATLPYARGPVQEAQLYELLSGAVQSLRQLGVVLTGGHTTEGSELALGFAVTGYAEEDRLFQKSKLRVGDQLILTKPLGSGALLAAWMRGACKAVWFEKLLSSMLLSNGPAAEVFRQAGVVACTDVTGFGLTGHLLEMLDGSRLSARIHGRKVPQYEGFAEVVGKGIVSSLQRDNAKAGCRVMGTASLPEWLFDPQTSGGLVGAVNPELAEQTITELHRAGYPNATVIGEVIALAGETSPSLHLV